MMRVRRSFSALRESLSPNRLGPLALLGTALMGAGMLAGCSSTPTTYYVLSPQPGAMISPMQAMNLPQAIEVLTPSTTARLDRDGLLRVMSDSQDHMVPAAAWSEPLNEMVGHTLAANLRQRLPGHVVFSQNDSVGVKAGAYLELSLSRFEQDKSGHAIIVGVMSAHRADAPTEQARAVNVQWVSSQSVDTKQPVDMVKVLGEGVGVLSDQAIQLLSSLPPMPVRGGSSHL
ncbi:PqiC family protein [Bombella sp. TMW 2.2559]|uniref:PqiC family protein n=1 Tax=Bombella dulcis TaxID=2967339 RepID=A0ABT3WJG2_9PROT|nr:ABC-type transport auxiliary lipoprotein family protein [Bombella dulcis]MCX5616961.1 PqiC family protein [Bombella dulcis]